MSAPRTVLAGLLLGALSASLLQGCDPGVCGGQGRCPTPRLLPFLSGTYRQDVDANPGAPGAETGLSLSVDEARARVTERYERDGHTYETEYEVVQISPADAWRGGVPRLP